MITKKRLNISIDIETYNIIKNACKTKGIKNAASFLNVLSTELADIMREAEQRRKDLAGTDSQYIEDMFKRYASTELQPEEVPVPKRGHNMNIEKI